MCFPISAYVFAGYVRHVTRVNHGVVECRVEDRLVVVVALHLHAAQCLLPGGAVVCIDRFEAPMADFAFQVFTCAFHTDKRDACLEQDLFAGGGRKFGEEAQVASLLRFQMPSHSSAEYIIPWR